MYRLQMIDNMVLQAEIIAADATAVVLGLLVQNLDVFVQNLWCA